MTIHRLALTVLSLAPLAASALAAPPAPQFAIIQTDSSSYTVGQQASVTVSVLIQPGNPNDEIALVAKLGGNRIDLTQLSISEWATVTPALETPGTPTLEVDVYLQDKIHANSLNGTIAFYEEEICKLQQQLSNEHDADQQTALKDQIARDQGLIEEAKLNLDSIRRRVGIDTDTLTVNPAKPEARTRADNSPVFIVDADHSNRIYREGDVATFSLRLLTSFTGPDGPQEVVARGLVDGDSVGALQGSPTQFGFSSSPFTDYQIGPDTFTGKILIRSQARANSIRAAIAQAEDMKAQDIAAENSTSDPDQQAYEQQQITQLTTLIGQYYSELESMLTPVGTQTLDFTVEASDRNLSLTRTGSTQTLDLASQIASPSGTPLKVTNVTGASRGTVSVGADGTVTYTPDPSKLFRVILVDTAPDGQTPSNGNTEGNIYSYFPLFGGEKFVGGTTRYLSFSSVGTNLSSGASSGKSAGYVFDLVDDSVAWVTQGLGGVQPNAGAPISVLSDNGQWVSFESPATNLWPGTNSYDEMYLRDRITGALSLVSVAPDGSTPGNANSSTIFLSGDASSAMFNSTATNLVSTPAVSANGPMQVYERDLIHGQTRMISVDDRGMAGNGESQDTWINQSGRFTIFASASTGSAPFPAVLPSPGPQNAGDPCWGSTQVYVHDRDASQANATTLVSADKNGNPGNYASCSTQITADGRYAIFMSYSTNFVSGASGKYLEAYIKDSQTGAIQRLVSAFDGSEPQGDIYEAAPSPDARYLAVVTSAPNIQSTPLPANAQLQCYVVDRQSSAQPVIVSVNGTGTLADQPCWGAIVSPDGQYAGVIENADNITGVKDGLYHLYLVSKTDRFTYTAVDQLGDSVTGTVTLTEPLTGTGQRTGAVRSLE